MLRVAFIGAVKLSQVVLEALLESADSDVVCCVARPNDGYHVDWADLATCVQLESSAVIPVLHTKNANDPLVVSWIAQHEPDVIFCCGWGGILGPELLALAPRGVVGYHPTMLPEGRGRHPIIWSLALGLDHAGSTFFLMDEGVDTGNVLAQKRIPVTHFDDAGSLYERICDVARTQVACVVQRAASGSRGVEQRLLLVEPSTWPKRGPADARIDWRMSTESICNLVRALRPPYRGARCSFKELDDCTVWEVSTTHGRHAYTAVPPGTVINVGNESVLVRAGNGVVALVRYESKHRPGVGDWLGVRA